MRVSFSTNRESNTYSNMSVGTKRILQRKNERQSNLEKMKERYFSEFGNKEDISILDLCSAQFSKQCYVTNGMKKFETDLNKSIQKIRKN